MRRISIPSYRFELDIGGAREVPDVLGYMIEGRQMNIVDHNVVPQE